MTKAQVQTLIDACRQNPNDLVTWLELKAVLEGLKDLNVYLNLTTTGSSGAATYDNPSSTLNVPNYTLTGLGGVPSSRTLTINGTTLDLTANRSWSVGTVTSVGLSMPSAFVVANSPITSSGTLQVTAAGLASQYIRGDGTLADFPGGGGSGGASVSYYLNGSVNQGTIGGVTYYEMNKTPILGAGTNFSTSSNGYIASFLTDANDPALLKIPGGNWNTEFYFAASSGGGTPTYYLELYKYDGSTFTLIASNSSNPDAITGGTSVEQYFTTLAVPETILTATDRLAIRIYVNTAGRTITLHTENSNLCQIITTFTTGLTALNGLTAQVQYFATGSSGTDFNISSSTSTHTFNIPTASALNRGLLSTTDWNRFNNNIPAGTPATNDFVFFNGSNLAYRGLLTNAPLSYNASIATISISQATSTSDGFLTSTDWVTFNNKVSGNTGIVNYLARWKTSSEIEYSTVYDNGTFVGINTATDNLSGAKLQVSGAATFSSSVTANNIESTNMGRFKGWYVSGTGAAAEIGVSGGIGYLYGYNRTTSSGIPVEIIGTTVKLGVTGVGDALTISNTLAATFSGIINANSAANAANGSINIDNSDPTIRFRRSGGTANKRIYELRAIAAGGVNDYFQLRLWNDAESSATQLLGIDATGAATFSSSVQTTDLRFSGQGFITYDASNSGTAGLTIRNGAAATALSISASGNLGLGVTPSAWSSTFRFIDVNTGAGAAFGSVGTTADMANNAFTDGTWTYKTTAAATLYRQITGQHTWFTAPSGTAGNAITFTQAMTLTASGNLGIGTASPGRTLHVLGQTGIGTVLKLEGASGTTTYLQLAYNGATNVQSGYIGYNNSSQMQFFTNDTLRATIDASGNVGIGTASPSGTGWNTNSLSVQAYKNDTDGALFRATSSNTDFVFSAGNDIGYIATLGADPIAFYTNLTERLRITSGGRVLIGTTTDNTVDLLQVAGSGYFSSTLTLANGELKSSASLKLAANNSTIYLRPVGVNNSTGQVSIDNTGAVTFSSSVEVNTNLKLTNFTTSGTAGSIVNYVQITVGTTNYLLPLYNLP